MSSTSTIHFENSRGWRLAGTLTMVDQKDAPLVVVAHEMGENRHTPAYRQVLTGLSARGVNTLALDLSGHGDSEGRVCDGPEQSARDIASAVAYALAQPNMERSAVGLAGSGMSGTGALYAMVAMEVNARTAVLRSPPLYQYERLVEQLTLPVLILVGSLNPVLSELRTLAHDLPDGSVLQEFEGSEEVDITDVPGAAVEQATIEWMDKWLNEGQT